MALKKKKESKKNSSSRSTTHREVLEEIIRVDHAGEYGATKIYDGQIAIFGKSSKLGFAATIHIEITQKDIPTKSFGSRPTLAEAIPGSATKAAVGIAIDFKNLIIEYSFS